MKGLLVLGAKPKAAPMEGKGSAETDYAKEAFSAIQEGDEEGFVAAFLAAVRSCAGKAKGAGYEADSDDDDEM